MAEKVVVNEFVILQRKLQELECDINNLFTDPAQADDISYHSQAFEEIERRIMYLKHLISAEMKVRHEQPEYLHQLADTLKQLETNVFSWAAFWEMPGVAAGAVDTLEACSCIYSCFNEENDNAEEAEKVNDDAHSDLECESDSAVKRDDQEGEKKEHETRIIAFRDTKSMARALLLPVFVAVVLVAAGFNVNGFHQRDGFNEFLRPT